MKIKMYCIFAMESIKKMGGNRGKLAAMSGHAYLHAFWDATQKIKFEDSPPKHPQNMNKLIQAQAYRESKHAYKICLVVDTVTELETLYNAYKDVCGVSLVKDAGFTVFDEPTVTCLGLGPISEDNIGDDIKALKVLM